MRAMDIKLRPRRFMGETQNQTVLCNYDDWNMTHKKDNEIKTKKN